MGFDLSAVDAELEQLGRAPEDPLQLARTFAGSIGSLANVDDELSALAQVSGVPEALYVTRPARAPEGELRHSARAPDVARQVLPLSAKSSIPPGRRSSIPMPPAELSSPAEPEARSARPAAQSSEPPAPPQADEPELALNQHSDWPTAMSGEPSFHLPEGEAPDAEGLGASTPADSWRPPSEPATGQADRPQSEPAREAVPVTQSQEIVLPDPIPREELSTESGELSLDAAAPNSGSYSLPDAQPQRDEARSFTRGGRDFAELVDDEIQDALDGSRPLSLGAPAVGHATRSMDRDPDAEFDALLSEATDPRGIPVIGGSELDADDLLRGLDLDDLDMEETPITQESEADQATHEADELARSLYEEAEPDNTEILDRASALAIEAQAPRAAGGAQATEGDTFREEVSLDAELDSGELEIMLEDEPAPPPPPSISKAPPPPLSARVPEGALQPGAGDKRPSILGRFFGGKRDGE